MKTTEGSCAMKRRAFAVLTLAAVLVGVFAVTALGRGDQSSKSVTVRMSGSPPNFRFSGVPENLSKGTVKFTFRNTSSGQVQHNFTVIRTIAGGKTFKSQTLAAGKSQTLNVNMTPGTYVAICTVGNGFHAAHHMVTAFQVQ
jgi:uncharacterized cupredoxin-like copper-binding protein